MPQVSLYMNDASMTALRQNASKEHVSLSKLVGSIVEDYLARKESAWPKGYWEDVYGCLDDGSFTVGDAGLDDDLDDSCNWFEEA